MRLARFFLLKGNVKWLILSLRSRQDVVIKGEESELSNHVYNISPFEFVMRKFQRGACFYKFDLIKDLGSAIIYWMVLDGTIAKLILTH